MKKNEVALQIRDGNEALRYSGKKRALLIRLCYVIVFFYLVCNHSNVVSLACKNGIILKLMKYHFICRSTHNNLIGNLTQGLINKVHVTCSIASKRSRALEKRVKMYFYPVDTLSHASLFADLPLVLSDRYVGFIDPHRTTVNTKETSPAGVKKKIKDVFKYEGHISTFHGIFGIDKEKPKYKGTLFRFPLRQPSSGSKISTSFHTIDQIREAHYESLKCEAQSMLLFLKNVVKVSLYDMNEITNEPTQLFEVKAENAQKLRTEKDLCHEKAKERAHAQHGSPPFIQLYSTAITTKIFDPSTGIVEEEEKYNWLIMNVIGSSDANIIELSRDLSILPWIGIAAEIPQPVDVHNVHYDSEHFLANESLLEVLRGLLSRCKTPKVSLPRSQVDTCLSKSGQAFCFLPLPICTALPINIHGYFAVSKNRRSIKWPGHDEKGKEALWNQHLFRKIIIPAYSLFLSCRSSLFEYHDSPNNVSEAIKEFIDPYSAWPIHKEVQNLPIWSGLLENEGMFSYMRDFEILWTSACGGKWVSFTSAYFIDNICPDIAIKILLNRGLPIVFLPESIYHTIMKVDKLHDIVEERQITPKILRRNFPRDIKLTKKEEVYAILTYIFQDVGQATFSDYDILNLPLLPLRNGSYCCFNEVSPKYFFPSPLKFCLDFLPGIDNSLIDTSMPPSLEKIIAEIVKSNTFSTLIVSPNTVCKLLSDSIAKWLPRYRQSNSSLWYPGRGDHPDKSWLKKMWKWITEHNISVDELVGLPVVPQRSSANTNEITLFKFTRHDIFYSNPKESNHDKASWHSLFINIGIVMVDGSLTCSFFSEVTQEFLIEHLNRNFVKIDMLTNSEKDLLRSFLCKEAKYKKIHINYLRTFPLFLEGVNPSPVKYLALNGSPQPYLPPAGIMLESGLCYPPGILHSSDTQTVCFIQSLGTEHISFRDFCINHLIPHAKKLIKTGNASDASKIVIWIFSELLKVCTSMYDPIIEYCSQQSIIRTEDDCYKKPVELYSFEDENFKVLLDNVSSLTPGAEYKRILPVLKRMGLKCWENMSKDSGELNELLAESMYSIQRASIGAATMMERSGLILEIVISRNSLQDSQMTELSKIPFLVACDRPKKYPAKLMWFGGTKSNKLFSISELAIWTNDTPGLVGSVVPILSEEYDITQASGCKHFHRIANSDVKKHLSHVESLHINTAEVLIINEMVGLIYSFLSREKSDEKLSKVWWYSDSDTTPSQFIDCSKVISKVPFTMEPYIYELKFQGAKKDLWGVEPTFNEEHAIMVLNEIQKTTTSENRELNLNELEMSVMIIYWLYNSQFDNSNNRVLMPTEHNQLKLAHSCFYEDKNWLSASRSSKSKTQTLDFVNSEKITATIASYFHVKPFSQLIAPSKKLQIEYTMSGQNERITNRISRIVQAYEGSIDIFKELIQNADDACASEIQFLSDWRKHPDKSIFTDELKEWQGPALLAYNDSKFSENDLKNICKVAGKTKTDNPMKTGRFGVGFCATYRLSDLPSFVTGKHFMMFDPHTTYLGDRVSPQEPGITIDLVKSQEDLSHYKDQFAPYDGIFGCDVFNLKGEGYAGTLFRFPFRNSQTSKSSKISNQIYGHKEVDKLISSFKNSANELILFQKYIKSISLYEMSSDSQTPVMKFSIKKDTSGSSYMERIDLLSTPIQIDDLKTCSSTCNLHIQSDQEETTHWIICSAVGRPIKFQSLLSSSDARGLVPFTEIALPVNDKTNADRRPVKVNGKVFCFLPLPISTGLGFHVNGFFNVSSDRRSVTLTDDDSFGTQWNRLLAEHVLSQVYISVLQELSCELSSCNETDKSGFLESYYKLWSFESCVPNSIGPCFIQAVKTSLPESRKKLLWSEVKGGHWISPQNCSLFLDRIHLDFRDDKIRCSAEDVMLRQCYNLVIKLPDCVVSLLKESIKSRNALYDYEGFISEVLFSLKEEAEYKDSWKLNLIFLLEHIDRHSYGRYNWAKELLKSHCCIPCEMNSVYMPINALIEPKSPLAKLYDVSEGRFPINEIMDSQTARENLRFLGMSHRKLSMEKLEDRVRSVATLASHETAVERSDYIMEYIETAYRFVDTKEREELKQIQHIQFLPVCEKPPNVNLPWIGKADELVCPSEVYSNTRKFFVFTEFKTVQHRPGVEILGIQTEVSDEVVLKHLRNLISDVSGKEVSDETKKFLDKTMLEIYKFLDFKLILLQGDDSSLQSSLVVTELRQLNCPIWIDGAFRPAENVVKHAPVKCSPYVIELPSSYTSLEILFFKILEVKDELTLDMMLKSLTAVYNDHTPSPLSKEILDFVVGIAQKIHNKVTSHKKKLQPSKEIYLPDENGIMRPCSLLACDNLQNEWIKGLSAYQEHFSKGSGYYVHKSISSEVAKTLGVHSLLDAVLQEFEVNDFMHGSDFGQHEKLCDRLSGILKAYPQDVSIFQEFIQNADDAHASEIAFILDHRTNYPDRNLLCDNKRWKSLQHVPSLCIVNNRKFSEEDIKGLSELGRGAKRESDEAIGKFGIGFNVAYHVSDCPSFLSYDVGGVPENLCVLDPTLSFVATSTRRSPGRRWKLSGRNLDDFNDQFKPYLHESLSMFSEVESRVFNNIGDEGYVVFRLPLNRTLPKQAKEKVISGANFEPDDVRELFSQLKDSSQDMLLFLNHITSISAFEIGKDGKYKHCFSTFSKIPSRYEHEYENFINPHGLIESTDTHSIFHEIEILQVSAEQDDQKEVRDTWLVQKIIHGSFTKQQLDQTKLRAVGGVATLRQPREYDYKVFCYLPLPIDSHLPVHVNGCFAINDSRKHLESGKSGDCKDWNQELIQNLVVPAYIQLIVNAKELLVSDPEIPAPKLKEYLYNLFPDKDKEKGELSDLNVSKLFYQQMLELNPRICLCEGPKMEWTEINRTLFPMPHNNPNDTYIVLSSEIIKILSTLGMQITAMAPHHTCIFFGFESVDESFCQKCLLDQNKVYNLLRGIDDLPAIKENLQALLNFCLKGIPSKDVHGILSGTPLLLSADGKLQRGGCLYHSKYLSLFLNSLNLIVDDTLEKSDVGQKILIKSDIIIDPPVHKVANSIKLLDSFIPLKRDEKLDEIVSHLWSYLHSMRGTEKMSKQDFFEHFQSKAILPADNGMLYPICLSKLVIGNGTVPVLLDLLQKLGYAKLDNTISTVNNGFNYAISNSEDLLPCLELDDPPNCDADLTFEEVHLIIQNLFLRGKDAPRRELIKRLRKLKLFKCACSSTYIALADKEEVIIFPSNVPIDGVEIVQSTVSFLKEPDDHTITKNFYQLVIPNYSKALLDYMELYKKFILPNISKMKLAQILLHIDFIRSNLNKSKDVIETLKSIPFLENDQKLVLVNELYDPRREFFKAFREDKLPSKEWHTDERLKILTELGLHCDVTMSEWSEQAIRFSKQSDPLLKSKDHSELLLDELIKIVKNANKDDPEFISSLKNISSVQFMYRYEEDSFRQYITKNFTDSSLLNMFLSFEKSVSCQEADLAFLHRSVLPSKCDEILLHSEVRKALEVEKPLQLDTVLKHFQSLCEATARMSWTTFSYHEEIVKKIHDLFISHCACIDKFSREHESLKCLRECACIAIIEDDLAVKLLTPSQVVSNLPNSWCSLEPFCYKLPPKIAQFTHLVRTLGIRELLNAQDFAKILKDICEVTEGKLDDPNDSFRNVAECAYNELIRCERRTSSIDKGFSGPLLSQSYELLPVEDLIYNDAPWYAEKMKQCDDYKYLKLPEADGKGQRMPPRSLNVRFLSEVVKEEVHSNCKSPDVYCNDEALHRQQNRNPRCIFADKIQNTLESLELAEGLCRIYHATHLSIPPKKFKDKVAELGKFEVYCLQVGLEIVLCRDGNIIPGSEDKERTCKLSQDEGLIYISPHTSDMFDIKLLLKHLSKEISIFLENVIKNEQDIASLFECDPEQIHSVLTLNKVPEYSESQERADTSHQIGSTSCLSTLQDYDILISMNFRQGEKVKYYSPDGSLILAEVVETCDNMLKSLPTEKLIKVTTYSMKDRSENKSPEVIFSSSANEEGSSLADEEATSSTDEEFANSIDEEATCLAKEEAPSLPNEDVSSLNHEVARSSSDENLEPAASEPESGANQEYCVSPLELFKILTKPQRMSLMKDKPLPFSTPVILAPLPVNSIKSWLKEVYTSPSTSKYSGLQVSMMHMRLISHLHYHLIVKKVSKELFKESVFEILNYAANVDLPCSIIHKDSILYKNIEHLIGRLTLSSSDDSADEAKGSEDDAADSNNQDTDNEDNEEEEGALDYSRYFLHGGNSQVHASTTQGTASSGLIPVQAHISKSLHIQASVQNMGPSSSKNPSAQGQSSSSIHSQASAQITAPGNPSPKIQPKPSVPPSANSVYNRFKTNRQPRFPSRPNYRNIPQPLSRFKQATVATEREPETCMDKARAWLEQAKVDFKAAKALVSSREDDQPECVEYGGSREFQFPALICFLCHEVIEKCLKGVLFAFLYKDLSSHLLDCNNLMILLNEIKCSKYCSDELKKACEVSVMVINEYQSKSRYPHFHNPPCAPAVVHQSGDAAEAFKAVHDFILKLKDLKKLKDLLGDIDILPKQRFISSLKSATSSGS